MKEYSNYIFDFDGTLFNTYNSLIGVYQDGFAKVGKYVSAEEAAVFMHESLFDSCKRKQLNQNETVQVVKTINIVIDEPKHLDKIEIYSDTKEIIETLYKNGKNLMIFSNNTKEHILLVLKKFNLDKYFSNIVGASLKRKPKPYPDGIIEICNSLKSCPKDSFVYIGDSLQDTICAENAKINGILIDRNNDHEDYKKTKISTLYELLK